MGVEAMEMGFVEIIKRVKVKKKSVALLPQKADNEVEPHIFIRICCTVLKVFYHSPPL